MKNNLNVFIKSTLAGVCIAIGCNVYLSCENKYIGAFLFTIGLITILLFNFNLYTGKVGYIVQEDKKFILQLIIILLGNILGCIFIGLAFPSEKATTLCEFKLNIPLIDNLFKSIMCGILMFIAVDTYKNKKTLIPTLICIPTFILSGYEHSIANVVYFTMGRVFNIQTILFFIIIIIGNAIGGLIIPLCNKVIGEKQK